MKKFLLVAGLLLLTGCQDVKQSMKSLKTSTIGADRVVTLFALDGSVIKQWEGRMSVVVTGSTARFIADGKVVHVSGSFVIQEK